MKRLFTGFSEQRNASGERVIELSARLGAILLGVLVVPPAAAAFLLFSTRGAPGPAPWFVLWAAIGMSIIGAGFLLLFMAPRSHVRITVDRSKGELAVESANGRAVLPLRDVARAEIVTVESPPVDAPPGTVVTIGATTTMMHRLELVLRSGQRVPASAGYFSGYGDGDRDRVVKAINQELG